MGKKLQPLPPTGIKVFVVGAGFAGLGCALECYLQGHEVVVLESFPSLKVLGDILSFGPNAGRIFDRWQIGDEMWEVCAKLHYWPTYAYDGRLILNEKRPQVEFGHRSYNGHRGELHAILWQHILDQGIEIRCNSKVSEYLETETESGVICNGERLYADMVVGADGLKSKARTLVLGYEDPPKSSGYAIYRTWFKSEGTGFADDPLTNWLVKDEDQFALFIGSDIHFVVNVLNKGKDVCWVMTHKDEHEIKESWSLEGSVEEAAKLVKDWDPRCAAIVKKAPRCFDWKLVYRDPLPKWISDHGRLVLIGDAAHPFLPTSIQGASQAIEDGVTLAATLRLSGKKNVKLAAQAFEKIRYPRVRRAQRGGETNRDKLHKTDVEAAVANPESIKLPREEWLLGFDALQHTYDVFDSVKADLEKTGYQLPTL